MVHINQLRVRPVPPLVSISKTKSGEIAYVRYQGKAVTNHITADGPLSPDDVEMYRVFPADFLGESIPAPGPIPGPEAA